MPKQIHSKLARQARKRFGSSTSERAKRYIYGTLNNILGKTKGVTNARG